ncbi:MAG TPA: ATP-dependent zinc metalloprotease FtsH [Candidatus Dormibacteraeota bacterium]
MSQQQPPPPEQGNQQSRRPNVPNPMRGAGFWLVLVVLFIANYLIAQYFTTPHGPQRVTIAFSQFKSEVSSDNVTSITAQGDQIDGHAKHAVSGLVNGQSAKSNDFTTTVPQFGGSGLQALLDQHKVTVNAEEPSQPGLLETLLFSFGPTILLVLAFVWLIRRSSQAAGGGVFGLGRTQARLYDAERPGTTFNDVAGIDEAKEELYEIVDFLKEPQRYQRLGGTIPKGVLLVGLPGTGKTLLARAVAGEAKVPFFSVAASEFVEMIVGVGASRVRDLFSKARQTAPAIIFIDELDAIGRARGGAIRVGGHDEQEQTLNQILTEMDGFDSREGVIVLAATNRADVLDPALLRPGRFDRRVMVQPPDRAGREKILKIHTREVPLANPDDLGALASQTPGLVGADLRNLVNEAALLAARRERQSVTLEDFQDALEKVMLGRERHIALSQPERERIAYHESGHALLGLLQEGADPVRKVSIVPRGEALGVTVQAPEDDRFNYPEDYLRARIVGALGGRAAEQLVYGVVSTGAQNDLENVTAIARNMVARWGMSPKVGPLSFKEDGGIMGFDGAAARLSDATSELIDQEIRRIVEECFDKAMKLLTEHRKQLDALAEALLKEESLDEPEILKVTGIEAKTA